MKENYFFSSLKKDLERKNDIDRTKPLTINEYDEAGQQKPMELKDYWLSLRQSIQEKVIFEDSTSEEQEKTKLLSELITPELMAEYKQILKGFGARAEKSKEHPQREFIDVNDDKFSEHIENWIKNLINEVRGKREIDFNKNDVEELRAQCWLLFDSIGSVMNTKSLERDIAGFYRDKAIVIDDKKEQARQKLELIAELQKRYPINKVEIEILIDLVKNEGNEFSFEILTETIGKIWNEYGFDNKKIAMTKISLGYLMSKGIESFAPSTFKNIIVKSDIDLGPMHLNSGDFNAAVFAEYLGLNNLSEFINIKIEVEVAKLMHEVNQQLNKKITDSLFFQEFEFMHEKSLGEIFKSLESGKTATREILQGAISELAPSLSGIFMSLGFLANINPALGAIGLGSLPVMFAIAKKQNEKNSQMYDKERKKGENIATSIGSVKSGFEEIKTSPDSSIVASHLREQMNEKDEISLERVIKEKKMRFIAKIPLDIAMLVGGCVGAYFQQKGMISGGEVLSNAIYSGQLNMPVQRLLDLYINRFSYYIKDIQRMDEILGVYEKLDFPDGNRESNRIAVSQLDNFDISIKNLRYKDILRNVNIDIKQGEFITIIGDTGSGKSTLFRNIIGLYKADKGSVEIGGIANDKIRKYGAESIYSIMSYCNQSVQIFEGMTLRDNLLLWSKKEVGDEEVKRILIDLRMDKFVDRLDEEIKHFSGGEKTRIGLARMLVKDAKIMLLDEPTTGLDLTSAKEFIDILLEMRKRHPEKTILCISHDERFIKRSEKIVDINDMQN